MVVYSFIIFFFLGVFSNWSGQCGSDWPLDELFLHEARACAISQKGVADHPLAWRIQHVLFSTFTFMSFPCVCVSDVCVRACACVSALLPVLPHQSSSSSLAFGGSAYRLLWSSVPLTPEGFPTLPWHPCAVTLLLHGGWQEGGCRV